LFSTKTASSKLSQQGVLKKEDIEALISLKLTLLQAKVYLVLATLREAKMSTISKVVHVSRPDLYRVMKELQDKGLVEKIISAPFRYAAIPINEAVHILLERINKERLESQKKAMNLIKRCEDINEIATIASEECKFVLVPKNEPLLMRIKKEIATSQSTIDVVCSWDTGMKAIFDLSPMLLKAGDRGVKIRWITNETSNNNVPPTMLDDFSKKPFFKMRYIAYKIAKVGIYDKKMILVASDPKSGYIQSPALYTNAPPLVDLVQYYFNSLWKKAEKNRNLSSI
jgi:sugar-specific transcriptional regulator TrmB